MMRTVPVILLVTVTLAGCLGGEARSEWAYDTTQLDAAAAAGHAGRGVRIGVLDTGINLDHASLDHLGDGDMANGELRGFRDFIDDRFGLQYAHDDHGHGSHVTGIISARGSSFGDKIVYGGIDLMGGAPEAHLWVAKVCAFNPDTDQTECPDPAIERALRWMASQDLDIVTMSLGGDNAVVLFVESSPVYEDEVNALIDAGVVVVASAGNDGPNNNDVNSPADIPGVIAVGAIDESGKVWSHSNRGSGNSCTTTIFGDVSGRCHPNQKPEILAPGVFILSAWKDDAYVSASGTSQAAPFIASTVALMLESEPRLNDRADVLRVKQALMDSAKKVPGQHMPHDDAAGYGIVQAMDAIEAF